MMSKPIIEIVDLGKKYRIGVQRERYLCLRDSITSKAQHIFNILLRKEHILPKQSDFWALRGISFNVNEGEAIGIIGRNGAGKSTLLKILSQITPPTEGKITMRGRAASLLEVGTGFHPELSGRENIFLNGAILGMTRKKTQRKFDEIVAFAGVEKFLDTPVKRYSSGMYVRLAFAVAAHLEPEILIVDEVLAVGDAEFQKKCIGKMQDVAKGGRTVLFVSHNMAAIENLCTNCVLLDNGKVLAIGPTKDIIELYLEAGSSTIFEEKLSKRTDRRGNGNIIFEEFWLESTSGKKVSQLRSGMDCVVALKYHVINKAHYNNVDVGITIKTPQGINAGHFHSSYVNHYFDNLPSYGVFKCKINHLPLGPNTYILEASIRCNGILFDNLEGGVGCFGIEAGDFYGTGKGAYQPNIPFLIEGSWTLDEQ